MPDLSELIKKRKFVKREYRPWDLSGTGTVDANSSNHTPKEVIADLTSQPESQSEPAVYSAPEISTLTPEKIPAKRTGNKTDNISGNKQVTNRQQTDNNQITPKIQRDNNEVTTREQLDNRTGNIIDNIETLAQLTNEIKKLSGIQKNIFFFILNICSRTGRMDTGNLLAHDLAEAAHCSYGSAKISLIRLIEKNLVIRLPGKACRGGHMVLGITKEIQSAAIQAKQTMFSPSWNRTTDNKTGNDIDNRSSYSSSNDNKTTTSLSSEWMNIDYSCLQDIGFSETQLKQLAKTGLCDPEAVQMSLHHFAFGLINNQKTKSYPHPLNVLMGVLRQGGVWTEKNYVSPREQALRVMLEHKKAEATRVKKLEDEIASQAFSEWILKISDEKKKEIISTLPPTGKLLPKGLKQKAEEGALKDFFIRNIYELATS